MTGTCGGSQQLGESDELGQIKGSWKQLKGKAQKEWGKLADDDLKTPLPTPLRLFPVIRAR